MGDYFEELGFEPLGEGQTPNHQLHFARLLRDYGMYEVLVGQSQPPPASKIVVENLPNKPNLSTTDQCTICLKHFEECETAKVLPCSHFFHNECILPWLEKTNSCPMCRHELVTDDEVYEEMKKERERAKQMEHDIEELHNSMFG